MSEIKNVEYGLKKYKMIKLSFSRKRESQPLIMRFPFSRE